VEATLFFLTLSHFSGCDLQRTFVEKRQTPTPNDLQFVNEIVRTYFIEAAISDRDGVLLSIALEDAGVAGVADLMMLAPLAIELALEVDAVMGCEAGMAAGRNGSRRCPELVYYSYKSMIRVCCA